MTTLADVVPAYIKLRDGIDAIEKKHKEELQPLKQKLELLDTWLLGELAKAGVDNMAVRGVGTVVKKTKHTVNVSDWDLTWPWIVTEQRFDLLNHAVNKTGVVAIVQDTGAPPPGVSYSAEYAVEVRRARGS